MFLASNESERLYTVIVTGGGTFTYDTIDVGRFALRMAEQGDWRPFFVLPVPSGAALPGSEATSDAQQRI